MRHHKEDPLCNIKKDNKLIGVKILMTSGTYLRSLSFSPEVLTTDKSLHDSSLCDDEVLTKDQVLRVATDSSVSDVHLHFSSSLSDLLEINTKELGKGLNVPGANLEENCSLSSGIETIMTANLDENSGSLGYNYLFPNGNLTSLRGNVIAVHSFDQGSSDTCSSCEDFGDLPHFGFSNRTNSCCIHVSMAHQTVNAYHNPYSSLFHLIISRIMSYLIAKYYCFR